METSMKFNTISSIALKDTKLRTKIKLQKKKKQTSYNPSLKHRTEGTNLLVTAPKSLFWATTCVLGFE